MERCAHQSRDWEQQPQATQDCLEQGYQEASTESRALWLLLRSAAMRVG